MKLIASLILVTLSSVSYAASTSDGDMPDEVRALIMKEKAKGNLKPNSKENDDGKNGRSRSGAGAGASNGCNMDIGNVNSGGRGTPRQVTTIVTGPVIQMNNKCN